MRVLALILAALVLALQYPLWFGKGGWLKARELSRQAEVLREENARLKARNDALEAEVSNLKEGHQAIEERARQDLGLMRQDEIFFEYSEKPMGGTKTPGAEETR